MQDLATELTLVTVSYNSAEVLGAHIESLRASASSALPRWLIVDNASTDQTDEVLKQYGSDVELIKNTDNVGFGGACNIGIAASKTRYVVVLNPDTELSESALERLLAELKAHDAAIAGPALEPADDKSVEAVAWLVGAVLLFDTEKMNPIGYFDERFFLYEEDVDICKCANDAGLKVIHCRNVSIPHVGAGSTVRTKAVNEFIHFHKGRSFVLYAQKHQFPAEHVQTYIRKNNRRRWFALLSFGRARYVRAKAKLSGVESVIGRPRSMLPSIGFGRSASTWNDEFKRSVIKCYTGVDRDQDKLCFFASFHPQGLISPFVLAYLRELRANGFDIILCTTSSILEPRSLTSALSLCHKILHRENIGHDFASWRSCFDEIDNWQVARAILFTNDSILGPLHSLQSLFERIDKQPEVFWGLNDNYQVKYHIQSFFLYCKTPVLQSKAFQRFWMELEMLEDKNEIIVQYEVGFSRRLMRAGLSHAVLFPAEQTLERCKRLGAEFQHQKIFKNNRVNTTRYCWYELIEYLHYPFLKSEIPRDNHYKSVHINKVTEILQRALPENDWAYIPSIIVAPNDGDAVCDVVQNVADS